jgi:N-acetylneuraminic acid mutarotase
MEKKNLAKRSKITRGMFALSLLIMLVLSAASIFVGNPSTANDLQNSWTVADQVGVPLRGNPGMTYDSESDRIVIFGGWNTTGEPGEKNETWTYDYDSDTYTKMNPSTRPIERAEPGIDHDSMRDEVIMFGGMQHLGSDTRGNDTWKYDLNSNTWTELHATPAPSSRWSHDMVYDSESDRFILFGGDDGTTLRDTWSYTPGTNVWTMMSPSIAPSARMAHKMVYDSESDIVILFGGSVRGATTFYSDTWAYDYNTDTWENITHATHPSERGASSLAYDSESDRIVLFGGSTQSSAYNDTWLFDYNTETWIEQSPSESPSARSRHGSAYDSQSDRVVIYGGTAYHYSSLTQVFSGKTWAYHVNNDTWTEMPGPATTPPPPPPTPPPPPILEWIAIGAGIVIVALVVVVLVRRR